MHCAYGGLRTCFVRFRAHKYKTCILSILRHRTTLTIGNWPWFYETRVCGALWTYLNVLSVLQAQDPLTISHGFGPTSNETDDSAAARPLNSLVSWVLPSGRAGILYGIGPSDTARGAMHARSKRLHSINKSNNDNSSMCGKWRIRPHFHIASAGGGSARCLPSGHCFGYH